MYMGDNMKKTEFITFRTNSETKAALSEIAQEKKWTVSQLVEQIVQYWLKKEERPEL